MGDGDLEQPRDFFEKILAKEPGQQGNLISNIAEHLAEADSKVRDKAYALFARVHPDLGRKVRRSTENQADDLATKKLGDDLEGLAMPFQPRNKRTVLDKNENLPCSLDKYQPNAGLVSRKKGVSGGLFGLE